MNSLAAGSITQLAGLGLSSQDLLVDIENAEHVPSRDRPGAGMASSAGASMDADDNDADAEADTEAEPDPDQYVDPADLGDYGKPQELDYPVSPGPTESVAHCPTENQIADHNSRVPQIGRQGNAESTTLKPDVKETRPSPLKSLTDPSVVEPQQMQAREEQDESRNCAQVGEAFAGHLNPLIGAQQTSLRETSPMALGSSADRLEPVPITSLICAIQPGGAASASNNSMTTQEPKPNAVDGLYDKHSPLDNSTPVFLHPDSNSPELQSASNAALRFQGQSRLSGPGPNDIQSAFSAAITTTAITNAATLITTTTSPESSFNPLVLSHVSHDPQVLPAYLPEDAIRGHSDYLQQAHHSHQRLKSQQSHLRCQRACSPGPISGDTDACTRHETRRSDRDDGEVNRQNEEALVHSRRRRILTTSVIKGVETAVHLGSWRRGMRHMLGDSLGFQRAVLAARGALNQHKVISSSLQLHQTAELGLALGSEMGCLKPTPMPRQTRHPIISRPPTSTGPISSSAVAIPTTASIPISMAPKATMNDYESSCHNRYSFQASSSDASAPGDLATTENGNNHAASKQLASCCASQHIPPRISDAGNYSGIVPDIESSQPSVPTSVSQVSPPIRRNAAGLVSLSGKRITNSETLLGASSTCGNVAPTSHRASRVSLHLRNSFGLFSPPNTAHGISRGLINTKAFRKSGNFSSTAGSIATTIPPTPGSSNLNNNNNISGSRSQRAVWFRPPANMSTASAVLPSSSGMPAVSVGLLRHTQINNNNGSSDSGHINHFPRARLSGARSCHFAWMSSGPASDMSASMDGDDDNFEDDVDDGYAIVLSGDAEELGEKDKRWKERRERRRLSAQVRADTLEAVTDTPDEAHAIRHPEASQDFRNSAENYRPLNNNFLTSSCTDSLNTRWHPSLLMAVGGSGHFSRWRRRVDRSLGYFHTPEQQQGSFRLQQKLHEAVTRRLQEPAPSGRVSTPESCSAIAPNPPSNQSSSSLGSSTKTSLFTDHRNIHLRQRWARSFRTRLPGSPPNESGPSSIGHSNNNSNDSSRSNSNSSICDGDAEAIYNVATVGNKRDGINTYSVLDDMQDCPLSRQFPEARITQTPDEASAQTDSSCLFSVAGSTRLVPRPPRNPAPSVSFALDARRRRYRPSATTEASSTQNTSATIFHALITDLDDKPPMAPLVQSPRPNYGIASYEDDGFGDFEGDEEEEVDIDTGNKTKRATLNSYVSSRSTNGGRFGPHSASDMAAQFLSTRPRLPASTQDSTPNQSQVVYTSQKELDCSSQILYTRPELSHPSPELLVQKSIPIIFPSVRQRPFRLVTSGNVTPTGCCPRVPVRSAPFAKSEETTEEEKGDDGDNVEAEDEREGSASISRDSNRIPDRLLTVRSEANQRIHSPIAGQSQGSVSVPVVLSTDFQHLEKAVLSAS
ncbi:unnamed protein product [Protopolystoma xenopodis]|uniref:Uncharacterized protein n=1 Tax=Protopolystoma xenopodis TaxID=117903 RepID=A0A448WDT3_9PLAT|nr:unnamed protein product [Protopolystoma xenopodis]